MIATCSIATDGAPQEHGGAVQAHGPVFGNWMLSPAPSGKVVVQRAPASQSVASMHGLPAALVQFALTKATLLQTKATPLKDACVVTPGRVVSTRAPVYWLRAT